jgi:tRNA threonylcarbamoyladenosine biosynthesis protein TsaB
VLEVPVVGIPSLDLVAYPWRSAGRRLVALVDARRKEVFAARYRSVDGGIEREGEYTVETPAAVAAELASTAAPSLLVGDGALEYAASFAGLDHVDLVGPAAAAPSVAALVELATARFARGETARAEEIAPLYLRRSDAEIAWDRR